MRKTLVTLFLLVLGASSLRADEGMWMVNAISRALESKMQREGLKMEAGEIYNEENGGLTDAIVSLDFGCTGSMVSRDGLLITNHHCAYSDVHALSTPEKNYLEDGFWARTEADEIRIPGKTAYFLKRVLDVTDEVEHLKDSLDTASHPMGMRKLSYLMEKKYGALTGLEASLSSMWAGSRYYLALYETFDDLRLVAAPPVSIAAFGGDIDNWEWPQHKCDFAMYRIYRDGKPYHPSRTLRVSREGYRFGDFAMVLGYPGRTNRYISSAAVQEQIEVTLPLTNEVRGAQMEIIQKWMNADPEIRLKYSDRFFTLSNVQENNAGLELCCKRFNVQKRKERIERRELKGQEYLVDSIRLNYERTNGARIASLWYRETMIRGCKLSVIATKMKTDRSGKRNLDRDYEEIDFRVERDLFRYGLEKYYENIGDECLGPYQKELKSKFGKDYDAMCSYLWADRRMKADDPLYKFFNDVSVKDFNDRLSAVEGPVSVSRLASDYTRALYSSRESRNVLQYPDANSTMRLTFGRVSTFPRDGRRMPFCTWSEEILAKEDSTSYDFSLKSDWKALLRGQRIPVDFITDNDITGGNSGSPVIDGRGRLIGLAFDGNKESLAGDLDWTPVYNKCVCVDIRFVLWTLKEYAHMDRILNELEYD